MEEGVEMSVSKEIVPGTSFTTLDAEDIGSNGTVKGGGVNGGGLKLREKKRKRGASTRCMMSYRGNAGELCLRECKGRPTRITERQLKGAGSKNRDKV